MYQILKDILRVLGISLKDIVKFWSSNKAVANVFPHKVEPSCTTRTGLYLLE